METLIFLPPPKTKKRKKDEVPFFPNSIEPTLYNRVIKSFCTNLLSRMGQYLIINGQITVPGFKKK